MTIAKNSHVEFNSERFILSFSDGMFTSTQIAFSPTYFKKITIELVHHIVNYESDNGSIDISDFPASKAPISPSGQMNTADSWNIRFEISQFRLEINFSDSYSIISDHTATWMLSPKLAKRTAVVWSNAIVHYEEAYGTIDL